MRVAGIEIKGHPGIGDLAIDFREPDGRAPRHIILAGGNGCGKTAVLEAIFGALIAMNLLMSTPSIESKGTVRLFVEPDFDPNNYVFGSPINDVLFLETRRQWGDFEGMIVELDWEKEENQVYKRQITNLSNNTLHNYAPDPAETLGNPLGCYMSVANTIFDVPPILAVTATSNPSRVGVSAQDSYPLFGTSTLASKIPQLFVDLESADGVIVTRWMRQNPGQPIPEDLVGLRIKQFQTAFSQLIPEKRFVGIETVDGQLVPQFAEHGRITPMAKLSTGEKQIVFRGAFLLRQADHMPGAVVMIDEPELSLHPNWQAGILDYYDAIVTEKTEKKSQIILATHSPFVVHGSPAAKHVVLRRNSQTGVVSVEPSPTYPGVTAGEIAVAAFDLDSFTFTRPGNTMVVAVEGKTDAQMISAAWEKLRPDQPMPFNLMASGSAGSLRQFLGHEPNMPGPLAEALVDRGIDRVLGIFDFDKEGHGYWNKGRKPQTTSEGDLALSACPWWRRQGTNIWSALLPVPTHRSTAAGLDDGDAANSILTTELLFTDGDLAGMINQVQVRHAPAGITRPVATNAQKTQIAEAAQNFPPEAFASFEPLLALIEAILAKQL